MQNNNIISVHDKKYNTKNLSSPRRRGSMLEVPSCHIKNGFPHSPKRQPFFCRIQNNFILFLSMLIISPLSLANAINSNDYWQCTTTDREDKQWVAKSISQRAAANTAYDACKKQSRLPATCKAAKEACEHFINGITDKPMWQCTALDQRGKPWVSNLYSNQDDAAIAAKAYCQESSAMPGSCFINMLTCKNRNSEK